MKLFSRKRRSSDCVGLHADSSGAALARVRMAATRSPVLVSSIFRAGNDDIIGSGVLDELAKSISATGNDLNVVLASADYQLLLVEAPNVDSEELRAAVRWRVKDLIDFHIDDAVFDVFAIPGQQNRPRGQAQMYTVAARAGQIQQIVDSVDDSSLQLQVIDIQELALRNLAALTEHDVRGSVMVRLASDGGMLTISRQRELYMTRQLDLDLSETEPVSATSDLDFSEQGFHTTAEELGDPPLFEQLLLEIQRSIDYYGSHFGQPAPAGLSILPGFSRAAELAEWLNDQLDQDVTVFDIAEHMECEEPLDAEGIDQRLIAAGGALRREEVTL